MTLTKNPNLSIQKSNVEADLIGKVEPVVENMGYLLRDLEVIGSGSSAIIRVTLDKEKSKAKALAEAASAAAATLDPTVDSVADSEVSKDTIGIEDCSQVHQILGPMFDVWDPLPHTYSLELASPGEKPNLRVLSHFQEALGEKIRFQTVEAVEMPAPMKPRRNWEGQLKDIDADKGEILLVDGYGEHRVLISKMKAATWLRDWTTKKEAPSLKPKHKNDKKGGSRRDDQRSGSRHDNKQSGSRHDR